MQFFSPPLHTRFSISAKRFSVGTLTRLINFQTISRKYIHWAFAYVCRFSPGTLHYSGFAPKKKRWSWSWGEREGQRENARKQRKCLLPFLPFALRIYMFSSICAHQISTSRCRRRSVAAATTSQPHFEHIAQGCIIVMYALTVISWLKFSIVKFM